MFDGRTWKNDHSKRVRFYGFFEEMPRGFRWFIFTMSAAVACFPLPLFLIEIGVLPEVPLSGGTALGLVLATLLMGALAFPWHARKWRALENAGLVDRGSFAFDQLQGALGRRQIRISDMNDRLDYEVGPRHITAFLRYTKRASRAIESGLLSNARRIQSEGRVEDIACGYADLIRFCFDQRELAKQARDRQEYDKARQIEAAMRKRVKAFYLTQDTLDWLSNHAAVSI